MYFIGKLSGVLIVIWGSCYMADFIVRRHQITSGDDAYWIFFWLLTIIAGFALFCASYYHQHKWDLPNE